MPGLREPVGSREPPVLTRVRSSGSAVMPPPVGNADVVNAKTPAFTRKEMLLPVAAGGVFWLE